MSGVAVKVDNTITYTDENGNYDLSRLPPGRYTVELIILDGEGTPAQGPVVLDLSADETIVQHLFYNSRPQVTPPTADMLRALLSKNENYVPPQQLPDTGQPTVAPPATPPYTPLLIGLVFLFVLVGGAATWRIRQRYR
jgi:hypothetical protein